MPEVEDAGDEPLELVAADGDDSDDEAEESDDEDESTDNEDDEDDKEDSTVHQKAATKVQATWKRYCCQSGYRKRLLHICIVQNVIRCKLARSRFDRLLRSKPPR